MPPSVLAEYVVIGFQTKIMVSYFNTYCDILKLASELYSFNGTFCIIYAQLILLRNFVILL